MREKTIVSCYPMSVTIGNYCWRPGINVIKEEDWWRVHWPSVMADKRLTELKGNLPEKEKQS
jgi:hypothetical protein